MTLISPDSYPQQGVMQLTALSARALRSTTGTCGYPLAGKERLFCYILIPPNLQNQWSQLRVDEGTRRRRCFQDHVLVLLFNSISLQHESCRQKGVHICAVIKFMTSERIVSFLLLLRPWIIILTRTKIDKTYISLSWEWRYHIFRVIIWTQRCNTQWLVCQHPARKPYQGSLIYLLWRR